MNYRLFLFVVLALSLSAVGFAQGTPAVDYSTAATAAKDSLVTTLSSVFPIIMGLLAVVIGARWTMKWIKRAG